MITTNKLILMITAKETRTKKVSRRETIEVVEEIEEVQGLWMLTQRETAEVIVVAETVVLLDLIKTKKIEVDETKMTEEIKATSRMCNLPSSRLRGMAEELEIKISHEARKIIIRIDNSQKTTIIDKVVQIRSKHRNLRKPHLLMPIKN